MCIYSSQYYACFNVQSLHIRRTNESRVLPTLFGAAALIEPFFSACQKSALRPLTPANYLLMRTKSRFSFPTSTHLAETFTHADADGVCASLSTKYTVSDAVASHAAVRTHKDIRNFPDVIITVAGLSHNLQLDRPRCFGFSSGITNASKQPEVTSRLQKSIRNFRLPQPKSHS